mgnify:CR=1 FL=1
MVDKHGGGSFGRDDLLLLQRFAVQCGISLRNATGGIGKALKEGDALAVAQKQQVKAKDRGGAGVEGRSWGGGGVSV